MRLTSTECPINIYNFNSASVQIKDRVTTIQCNSCVTTYRNLTAFLVVNQLYVKA
jgi:hypothetical protein